MAAGKEDAEVKERTAEAVGEAAAQETAILMEIFVKRFGRLPKDQEHQLLVSMFTNAVEAQFSKYKKNGAEILLDRVMPVLIGMLGNAFGPRVAAETAAIHAMNEDFIAEAARDAARDVLPRKPPDWVADVLGQVPGKEPSPSAADVWNAFCVPTGHQPPSELTGTRCWHISINQAACACGEPMCVPLLSLEDAASCYGSADTLCLEAQKVFRVAESETVQ